MNSREYWVGLLFARFLSNNISKNKEILKKFNPHNVVITDEITEKNISNIDCLIMLSSLNHCSDPEELNLKIQDIYNTLSLCVEQDIKKVIMVSSLEVFDYDANYTVTERWKVKPKKDFLNLYDKLHHPQVLVKV